MSTFDSHYDASSPVWTGQTDTQTQLTSVSTTIAQAADIPPGCTGLLIVNSDPDTDHSLDVGTEGPYDFVIHDRLTTLLDGGKHSEFYAVGRYAGHANARLFSDAAGSSNVDENDLIIIGAITYRFRATVVAGSTTQVIVDIGSDLDTSLVNLTAAINGTTDDGTLYSSNASALGSVPHSEVSAVADVAASQEFITIRWRDTSSGDTALVLDITEQAGGDSVDLWNWNTASAGAASTLPVRSFWLEAEFTTVTLVNVTRFYGRHGSSPIGALPR